VDGSQAFYGDSTTSDDGKFKKEDEHKREVIGGIEHIYDIVIIEDCSTICSGIP